MAYLKPYYNKGHQLPKGLSMKFLSLLILSLFFTVSCAHKKDCCSKDHCDKKESMSCCKQEKEKCKDGHCEKNKADCKDDSCKKEKMNCKDGHCDKNAPKVEEKKTEEKKKQ